MQAETVRNGSERCLHANCHCPSTPAHAPYCCTYCANAAEESPDEPTIDAACACGHDACATAAPSDPSPPESSTSIGHRRG